MRSVEEVLRVVADSEYYVVDSTSRDYMCISLVFAMEGGLISLEELRLAGREVRSYIEHLGCNKGCSLRKALWDNSLPNDFLDRKAIYLDWNNRPKPWEEGGV